MASPKSRKGVKLKLRALHAKSLIRTIAVPRVAELPGYWFYTVDPLPTLISWTAVDTGPLDCARSVGDASNITDDDTTMLTVTKPYTTAWDRNVDYQRYANGIDRIALFSESMGLSPRRFKPPSSEKDTAHLQILGDATFSRVYNEFETPSSALQYYNLGPWFPSGNYQTWDTTYEGWNNYQLRKDDPELYSLVLSEPYERPLYPIKKRLDEMSSIFFYGGTLYVGAGSWSYTHLYDLSYSVTRSRVEIEYSFDWHISPGGDVAVYPKYAWSCRNKFTMNRVDLSAGALPTSMFVGETRHILGFGLDIEFDSLMTNQWGWGSMPPPWGGITPVGSHWTKHWDCVDSFYASYPSPESSHITRDTLDRRLWSIRSHFDDAVRSQMPDIRASCFLSASDALTNITESLNSNMLENIKELPDIMEILPELKEGFKVLRGLISSKGLSITSWVELVRFLSSEKLRWDFGTRPSLELFIKTIPRMIQIASKLFSSYARTSSYGTHVHSFLNGEILRKEVSLVTRTKVVLNEHPSPELYNVLCANALGILPTPETVWELLPLSFVLDWFVNVKDHLAEITGFAALASISVRYFVHSFTLTSPLEEEEMAWLNLEPDGTPLFVKCYRREVSNILPFLVSSRYDFNLPTRQPPWMVAGPLAIVLSSSN